MENYIIHATDTFKKLFSALDRSDQEWIENIKRKLKKEPTGKNPQAKFFILSGFERRSISTKDSIF